MDYTLIHYDVNAWEGKAFAEGVANLQEMGCLVEGLTFQPDLVIRGLIVDKHLGNIVKADRFGYLTTLMKVPAGGYTLSTRCMQTPVGPCEQTRNTLEHSVSLMHTVANIGLLKTELHRETGCSAMHVHSLQCMRWVAGL